MLVVRFPTTATLAKVIATSYQHLSIPAMSAEPERVFSGGRRTISWERMQLGDDTIEIIECLKHWKRSGFIEGDLTTHEGWGPDSGSAICR